MLLLREMRPPVHRHPPLLNDEQWSRMERRFLTEHTPLTVVEGELLFLGWTSPRAWWEEES
jgi:hypothetical protein